jgi:hypothetical protein
MPKLDKVVKGYVCGIAWGEEAGHTDVTVYHSHAALKKNTRKDHYDQCAVIEIEMRYVDTIKDGMT